MTHHDGSSVAERAYEHIREGVLGGTYPTGARLVTRQIAEELGASLNPVREAIGRLTAEGLIDHVPGAGASVRAIDTDEILELYELRQAIEPFAAGKAARTISDRELAVLNQLCDEQHAIAESLRAGGALEAEALSRWHAIEERFHDTLIRAARNRHFERTIAHSRILTRLFHAHRALHIPVDLRVASRTWRSHMELVGALERRDAAAAAASMLASLEVGAKGVLATLSES